MAHKLGQVGFFNKMIGCVSESFVIGDFTDGGVADGYVDMSKKLPKGALVLGWGAEVKKAFGFGTSGLLSVGTTANVDEYTGLATDPVETKTVNEVGGSASFSDGTDGTSQALEADTTVRVNIVDGGGDFTTGVTAATGRVDVYVWYLKLVPGA